MRLLVAEDEPRVAAAIARGLRRHGAAVDVASDGAQALYQARVYPYDVVLLDRDLPAVHGDESGARDLKHAASQAAEPNGHLKSV